MRIYQVSITGIVQVDDNEPSPPNWDWLPESLANRITQDMEYFNVDFREMVLAPHTDAFVHEATNAEFKEHMLSTGLMVGDHESDCKWPDDSCRCQG
jgi:hypothetical protein